MKVRITNEHICPLPLVGREVEVERLRELYPGLEICGDPPRAEIWVPGETPRKPGRWVGIGFVVKEPEPKPKPPSLPVGFIEGPEELDNFLKAARAEGRKAHEAWEEARRGLMREVRPARYERTSDVYGRGAVVAVVEVDGVEVDRVAVAREWETAEGAAHLDALTPPATVRAFPYGKEATLALLRVIEAHLHTDYEDYRGNPLGSLYVIEWK
ncbi:MAG: hypothetical protein KatS3mg071_1587 [Meiothermus sp.]|nr:MAG: hypothetical protein KatS3mg071_1587 [Meiothermus sp.]